MAIVQISRITQRKGLQEDLPQLAGAELGWSVDERRLFIGNGTLEEGAPVVGNTEILTEFSDILVLVQDYIYSGQAATGYTVQTGASAGTPVQVSLQNWMDQFATVKDFGAVGDGITDDTAAINRALYQLYCREVNPAIRRSLFFPAGVYKVTNTIIIPPYATLQGEGQANSVIELAAGSPGNYVVRTGDSLQQTGVNIGTNSATPPINITVENMGFRSANAVNVALIDRASECVFNQVQFAGPLTTANLTTTTADISGVSFASSFVLQTQRIKFSNCKFTGCTYGIKSASGQLVNQVTIDRSDFLTLHRGVQTGTDSRRFGVTSCSFDTIYAEGIVFDGERNTTVQNTFGDVGNHFGGPTQPYTSIIDMIGNNLSVGDMFIRSSEQSRTYPRIQLNDQPSIAFTNGRELAMGSYIRETGYVDQLANNTTTAATILTFNTSNFKSLSINYSISRGAGHRTGVITIAAAAGPNNVCYTDDYTENSSTGITLTVTQTGSDIFLKYTSTNLGIGAVFANSITHIA